MRAIPSLHSERLDLVPCEQADADSLHALWTDADVRRYLWDDVAIGHELAAEVVQGFRDSAEQAGLGLWMLY